MNKKLRMWLIIFAVLVILVCGFLLVYWIGFEQQSIASAVQKTVPLGFSGGGSI